MIIEVENSVNEFTIEREVDTIKLDTAEEKFSKLEDRYKDAILKAAQRYKP